jgi:alkylation response protein AidB-like acyl-CoA dehydrogenase
MQVGQPVLQRLEAPDHPAETIYGASDEIQRNIIATRALGLPRP